MTKDEIRERLIELLREVQYLGGLEEKIADRLIANGVTVQEWIPVSEPPKEYRDEFDELIPFLVCEKGADYSFCALYDGKEWGNGLFRVTPTHWMPLPEPPKEVE